MAIFSTVGTITAPSSMQGRLTVSTIPGSAVGDSTSTLIGTQFPNTGAIINAVMSNQSGFGITVVDDKQLITDPDLKSMYLPSVDYNVTFSVDVELFVIWPGLEDIVTILPVKSIAFLTTTDLTVTKLTNSAFRISGQSIGAFNDIYRFLMEDDTIQIQKPTITEYNSLVQYTMPTSTSVRKLYVLNLVVPPDPLVSVTDIQTSTEMYQWFYWTPPPTVTQINSLLVDHF